MNKGPETTTKSGSTSKATEDGKIQQSKQCKFKFDKKFLRIEYPGIVQNIDKALDSFGGIERVEMVMLKIIKTNITLFI